MCDMREQSSVNGIGDEGTNMTQGSSVMTRSKPVQMYSVLRGRWLTASAHTRHACRMVFPLLTVQRRGS